LRFVDFLRVTVLLSAGSATTLAAVTVLVAGPDDRTMVLAFAAWWVVAGLTGTWFGRRAQTSPPVAKLLAQARSTNSLPEQRPGSVVLNRLWPLLLVTLVALGLALVAPQIPGIATGFTIAFALAWRRQEAAVTAIEDRDGVAFYVEATPPLKPIKLVRAPGFRRDLAPANGVAR
jgi:hypothetical protein